jgi:hypothetical protein
MTTGISIVVGCGPDFAGKIDERRRQEPDIPTRAEMLRRLARSALSKTKSLDGDPEMTGAAA